VATPDSQVGFNHLTAAVAVPLNPVGFNRLTAAAAVPLNPVGFNLLTAAAVVVVVAPIPVNPIGSNLQALRRQAAESVNQAGFNHQAAPAAQTLLCSAKFSCKNKAAAAWAMVALAVAWST
jgi:hypothetical protein